MDSQLESYERGRASIMGRYNYCAVEIMAVWARLGRDYDDTGTDDDDRDGGCGGIDGGGGFWIVSIPRFV